MPRALVVVLVALGVLLTATVVPGVFTIDEDNYIVTLVALRHGRLTVPGTEGLPASSELVWFDPQAHSREVHATPVASTAPPLWAPLALPFSVAGWRGLVALNTLGYLVAAGAVFLYARRYGESDAAGWLAAGAFALAGYSLEYAQGVWPHMATVACVAVAADLAARVRDGASPALAAGAGLLTGLATGMRYQNLLVAAGVGAGLWLFTRRRWHASAAYAGGLLVPLAASSVLNRLRLGSWNPISKGPRYFGYSAGAEPAADGGAVLDRLADATAMFWARVVDYSARPPVQGVSAVFLHPEPGTGAYVLGGVVKKAWLQSAPWIAVALLAVAAAWFGYRRARPAQRRELRAISLVLVPVLAVFALAGPGRTDGWSYNQRYFLELVPLVAVAFAWSLGGRLRPLWALAAGAAGGALLAGASLTRPGSSPVRQEAVMTLPLVLAGLLLAAWALASLRPRPHTGRAALLAAGLALGWAFALHFGEDLAASRAIRAGNRQRLAAVAPALESPAAVFAYWGRKDMLGPLLLERDLVVADPFADGGASAPALVAAFLERGRRVYLLAPFPGPLLDPIRGGRPVRVVNDAVLEVLPAPDGY